jgi:hypothetical protein
METSTLVLTALAQLNEQLTTDDGFCGYNDDQDGTVRLLNELWTIYYDSQMLPFQDALGCPEELVNAWYEQFYADEEAA